VFQDVHTILILGFGLIMAFLKRYGYGSVGFNLLLAAFVIQWSLLVHGWIKWNTNGGNFTIGIGELVHADFTTISMLVAYGILIGKTTALQLATMAFLGVLVQVANEHLNEQVFHAHDVGKAIYVHLFGCIYGLAVSKALHSDGVVNPKQSSVYHSDLFAFIGTFFFWVFYPSLNGIFAHDEGVSKAIINTCLSIAASTVVSIGLSSLVGNGRLNAMHVQHATFAGGIAIGSIADCNLQVYIALIIGSLAGLLSTLGYQYVTPKLFNTLRIHDSCGNFNLHGIPALLSGLFSVIFAMSNVLEVAKQKYIFRF
jgi:ammonium transporter Rh